MSLDPPPANDPSQFVPGPAASSGADTRPGPPPLVRHDDDALSDGSDFADQKPDFDWVRSVTEAPGSPSPPPLAPQIPAPLRLPAGAMTVAPPPIATPHLADAQASDQAEEPLVRRIKRIVLSLLSSFLAWCREDGYWYLSSMAFHAMLIMSLAMISLAIPRALLVSSTEKAPTFEAPVVEPNRTLDIVPFHPGDAPLDPSELTTESLTKFKPEPIGGQEEKYYNDNPEFKEAGGGIESDLPLPKLGGLGGLLVENRPGPAGKGGVGIGIGLGKNPGSGGDGKGFGQRGQGHRKGILGPGGGTPASERAVAAALNWIARHQTAQGKWSLDFHGQCKGGACSGVGGVESDAAATALALLPFFGAGQTHKSKGPYRETISKGIAWLVKQQRSDGDLSGKAPQPMYSHGIATLALCEAFGMTNDEHIGSAARRAVAYIERAQNESTGGWRYEPGDSGDTSVFGWQIMALKSAQLAGLPVNSMVFENSKKWLHSVAKGEHLGLYSYQPYREVTPTMTAVGMLCRQYLGIDPKDPSILQGKRCLLENLPDAKVGRNSYYWYYATLAMHNFADSDWDIWNRKMRRVLIESQEKEGCAMGSWSPDRPTADAWGPQGGRLMLTSLNALTLEVYYRYLPLFKTDSLVPDAARKMGFSKPIASKEE